MRTFGSLFAGVGGFDMGFEQAGWECLWQVEWDKHCQSVLNRHWPDVPKWGDVCDVDGSWLPHVDVLIFGSPCQDLSVAGKRAGIDGGRSSMFFEAIRIIKEMRNATGNTYPRIVVWENVPGALSSNKGEDFQAVLNEMGDCGSHLTEWAVLDAQHFGVPQRRRRIFLVAVLDPRIATECPDPLFPVAQGRRGDYQKGITTGEEIAGTLGGGSGSRGWSSDTDRMTFVPATFPIQGTIIGRSDTAGPQGPGFGKEDDTMYTLDTVSQHGVAQIADPVIAFTAQRVGEAPRIYEDSTPALLSRMGTGGNNTPMVTQPAVRRLTPLECERLMGWPDDHTRWTADGKEQSDSARYKQCGNGVATPVARWIAEHLRKLL